VKFSNILFPVDFSENCRAVAPFVLAVAKREFARLTLVHVVDDSFMWYQTPEVSYVDELSVPRLIEQAEHRLTFFADELFPGMPSDLVIRDGDPGNSVMEVAQESGIDLIMMPTRGLGRFRAALLGSVTAKVLHDAECPVWTATRPVKPASGDESAGWRNITCAIDTSDDALRIIRYARELHSGYGSAIHLVHAVPGASAVPEQDFDRDFDRFLKDSARQTIGEIQVELGTDFQLCVEGGKIPSVVVSSANRDQADLILIGRGAITHFGGRLRSHAYAIIRDATCPVLSV